MTFRYSILLLFLLSLQDVSLAQLSKPGIPPSFSLTTLQHELPVELMQMIDIASLEAEDMIIDTIWDIPWRFGENIQANLNPDNSGLWETTNAGDRVWRLGIRSPGAYSINLTFNQYVLPPGAELYIYNTDRSFVLGAFTEANNQEDMYFATSLVPGEEVVIEYFEPSGVLFAGILNIETVTHAYRSILDHTKRFGNAGPCHLNVACDEAEGWGNEIDAVVLMMVGSNSLCTGALINNTGFDGRPFLLSANHCFRNPSTLVFWFNWQSETCDNPNLSPPIDALSGAVTRARFSSSDFWLLELNQRVPVEYNPYFAGWNRTLDLSIDGPVVSIHHPRGDIKKFSYALDGAKASSYLLGPGTGLSHWHITWSGGTTTEIGSSGSALFDSYGRIIGQLHGGYAACGNTEPDWYGRLGLSWIGGNSSSTRLREWLDPYNSGEMVVDGYRPVFPDLEPVSGFTALTLSVDSIQLLWDDSSNDHPILIAWNTDSVFGTPAGTYSLDDPVAGGGKVLYMGYGEVAYFLPPYPNTTYYFRAWSFNRLGEFASGVNAKAVSSEKHIADLPYEEIFENDIRIPGWSVQADPGEPSWQMGVGNNGGNPSASLKGDKNAFYKPEDQQHIGKYAMLVSPPIDFGDFDFGWLSLYYTNPALDQHQDMLRVLYRPDKESEWTLLDSLITDTPDWTRMDYALPEISDGYQLGFLAQWNGGHGVCLDAISFFGSYDAVFPAPEELAGSIISGHSMTLNWLAPSYKEWTPELIGYQVYIDNQLVATLDDSEQNTYEIEGLGINSYTFYVTAVYANPKGESNPSNVISADLQPLTNTFSLSIATIGEGKTLPESLKIIDFNEGAKVSLSATPDLNFLFSGWWRDNVLVSAQEEFQLIIDNNYEFEARFSIKTHTLSLSSNPVSIGVQNGSGVYNHGESVIISTTVPYGFRFVGWKDGGELVSNRPAFSLEIIESRGFSAHFEPMVHISLLAEPSVAGLVRGGGMFEVGSLVDVRAYPNVGWVFDYWEENGEILTTNLSLEIETVQNRQLTAVFSIPEYVITAIVIPDEAGVVTGTGTYLEGETAVLVSVPNENWLFVGWFEQDTLVSSADTLLLIIDSNRHFEVLFEQKFYQLNISVEGNGYTLPAPGKYTFEKGEMVSLSANPNRGWRFRHWVINDEILDQPTIELEVNSSATALAVFYFPTSTATIDPSENSLIVYPNPGYGLFTLQFNGIYGNIFFEVYNMNGQQLFGLSGIVGSEHHVSTKTLDLRSLSTGVYLLKVTGNDVIMYDRIIIR
jgi:hypothetical protein